MHSVNINKSKFIRQRIGEKIREARLEKEWSQRQLSEPLFCNQSIVSRYEQGQIRNIDIEKLIQFAEALEKPIVFFLSDFTK